MCYIGAGSAHQSDLRINPEVISLETVVSWQFGGPDGEKRGI